jgi:hypothetical protein
MKRSQPVTYDTVRRMALTFPNVEEGTSYKTPALKVKGKLFVRWRTEADPDTIVLKMPFDQREELMAGDPETYFITEHYRNYAWVLVRLRKYIPTRCMSSCISVIAMRRPQNDSGIFRLAKRTSRYRLTSKKARSNSTDCSARTPDITSTR